MRPSAHILASSVVASFVWANPVAVVAAYLGGVMIDVDHLVDYYRTYTAFDFDVFWSGHYSHDEYVIPLHSIELAILAWVSVFFISSVVWQAFALSYTLHILLDISRNGVVDYVMIRRLWTIWRNGGGAL